MKEQWREISGFNGHWVSDLGRVKRPDGRITRGGGNGPYAVVAIGGTVTAKTFPVHRLVAEAFIGPLQPGMETNHVDHDKRNNRADNLEYVTVRENRIQAARAGHKSGAKLSEEQRMAAVAEANAAPYGSQWKIAAKYGIAPGSLFYLRKRQQRIKCPHCGR